MEKRNDIGIIKGIDKLGRILIPYELRKQYKLDGDIEIVLLNDGIFIRNPKYQLVKISEVDDKKR